MDTHLGVTVSLARLHVGVDNQPGMEGVRKRSLEVAATRVPFPPLCKSSALLGTHLRRAPAKRNHSGMSHLSEEGGREGSIDQIYHGVNR